MITLPNWNLPIPSLASLAEINMRGPFLGTRSLVVAAFALALTLALGRWWWIWRKSRRLRKPVRHRLCLISTKLWIDSWHYGGKFSVKLGEEILPLSNHINPPGLPIDPPSLAINFMVQVVQGCQNVCQWNGWRSTKLCGLCKKAQPLMKVEAEW